MVSALLADETLPATSVCLTVKLWLPSTNVLLVILHLPDPSAVVVPSSVEPSVSYNLTMALASDVPVIIGVETLVRKSPEVPLSLPGDNVGDVGAVGVAVSMVTARELLATDTFPAVSVCLTVRL